MQSQESQVQKSATVVCAIAALLVVMFVSAVANAQVPPELHTRWFVDDTAPTGGNGELWSTAFRDLQEALAESAGDMAPEGERNEIWVAAGIGNGYRPTNQEGGLVGEVREPTFTMQLRLAVFGGFEGWANGTGAQETLLAQRDPDANVTILTGELPAPVGCPNSQCFESAGPCTCNDCRALVCVGVGQLIGYPQCCQLGWSAFCADVAHERCSFHYKSYHVVTYPQVADAQQTAQLDGFTIISGRADGNDVHEDPPLLETFGGGLLVNGPLNIVQGRARPVIARCTLTGNHGDQGGGVHIRGYSDPSFLACSFVTNTAREGAGIHVEPAADPPQTGDVPEATLVNCLIAGNLAIEHGGGIVSGGPALRVTNSTLAFNEAIENSGGGIWIELGSQVTIRNSILWENEPNQILATLGAAFVHFSDVQGGWPCPAGFPNCGNVNVDPEFVDPVFDPFTDFRLRACSPVIDAADTNPAVIPPDNFDIDHDLDYTERTPDRDMAYRILAGPPPAETSIADMGAYEYIPPSCPYDCQANPDGIVGVNDLLALLAQWGVECAPCDLYVGGIVGVEVQDLLQLLGTWGPCGAAPEGVPTSVQQCINRYGYDPLVLQHCICAVDPCEDGCPPEGCEG